MITAIVFIRAGRIPNTGGHEEIADLAAVGEVYSVTGAIDLIAMVRVSDHEQIAEVVADRLNKVPGVVSTETHIAFRAYSAHDLEAAFSQGLAPAPGRLRATRTRPGPLRCWTQKNAILATTATRQTSMTPSKPTI